jgi:hypothetical protein
MGHIRLGDLPRTRPWKQVVGLIAGGAGAAQVANATITAAERGLSHAADDQGLVDTVWLLLQLPLAARSGRFGEELRACGLTVSDAPGLLEIVGALTDAVDARLPNNRGRTDLGEMAQMAAAETVAAFVGARSQSLFGTAPEDVRLAFDRLGTVAQFGAFAKDFFARLTNRCLDYFLSRALPYHVGEGQRFTTLAQQAAFSLALETHCREAAVVVERFAGEWFSKTRWEHGGITWRDAADFTHGAMQKLIAELQRGAQANAR